MGKKKRKRETTNNAPQANVAATNPTSSSPPGTSQTNAHAPLAANVCISQGHTWVINGAQAFLVSSPTNSKTQTTMPTPAINSNTNNYNAFAVMASIRDDEYAIPVPTMHHTRIATMDMFTTSLDWGVTSRTVPPEAMTAAVVPHFTQRESMDLVRVPFWLDSGASTHISPA